MYRKLCSASLIRINCINTKEALAFFNEIFCYFAGHIRMFKKFFCTYFFVPVGIKKYNSPLFDFCIIRHPETDSM